MLLIYCTSCEIQRWIRCLIPKGMNAHWPKLPALMNSLKTESQFFSLSIAHLHPHSANTSTYPQHRKLITSNGKIRNYQCRSRRDEADSECCTSPIFKPKIISNRTNALHQYGQVAKFIISPKINEIIRNHNLMLANCKIPNQNSLVRFSQTDSLIFFSSIFSHQNAMPLNFKPCNSIDRSIRNLIHHYFQTCKARHNLITLDQFLPSFEYIRY